MTVEPPDGDSLPDELAERSTERAAATIKSDEFLRSIVDDPAIASQHLLKRQNSPIDWLASQLTVGFDHSLKVPTVTIEVPAKYEQEGRALVENISDRYCMMQVAKAIQAASDRRSEAKSQFERIGEQLNEKLAKYDELVKNSGADSHVATDAASDLKSLQDRLLKVERELEALDVESSAPFQIRRITTTAVTNLGRW